MQIQLQIDLQTEKAGKGITKRNKEIRKAAKKTGVFAEIICRDESTEKISRGAMKY